MERLLYYSTILLLLSPSPSPSPSPRFDFRSLRARQTEKFTDSISGVRHAFPERGGGGGTYVSTLIEKEGKHRI